MRSRGDRVSYTRERVNAAPGEEAGCTKVLSAGQEQRQADANLVPTARPTAPATVPHTEGSWASTWDLSARLGPSRASQSGRYRLQMTSKADLPEAQGLASL